MCTRREVVKETVKTPTNSPTSKGMPQASLTWVQLKCNEMKEQNPKIKRLKKAQY